MVQGGGKAGETFKEIGVLEITEVNIKYHFNGGDKAGPR